MEPSRDCMIMVVDRSGAHARNLAELIEFMDTPRVRTAHPGDWRQRLGECRLEAVFVGPDLSDADIRKLFADVGKLDPNVPIVMLNANDAR